MICWLQFGTFLYVPSYFCARMSSSEIILLCILLILLFSYKKRGLFLFFLSFYRLVVIFGSFIMFFLNNHFDVSFCPYCCCLSDVRLFPLDLPVLRLYSFSFLFFCSSGISWPSFCCSLSVFFFLAWCSFS